MKIKKLASSLIMLLACVVSVYSQKADRLNYWLKIKPFESTKNDVEKIFLNGTTGVNDKYSLFYKSYYGGSDVQYSRGICSNKSLNMWNIPEWTVIEVFYTTDDAPPKLRSLLKDLGKYKTRPAGDRIDKIQYYNEEKGVSITYNINDREVIIVACIYKRFCLHSSPFPA